MAVQRHCHLLEIVGRLRSRGRLAHLLHGGKQESDQDRDDRDDDEKLDERKSAAVAWERSHGHLANEGSGSLPHYAEPAPHPSEAAAGRLPASLNVGSSVRIPCVIVKSWSPPSSCTDGITAPGITKCEPNV
jgi:hypothetical protein